MNHKKEKKHKDLSSECDSVHYYKKKKSYESESDNKIKYYKGERGSRGAKGPEGERGEKGERGERGEKGDRGRKGDQGEIGYQGEEGEKGDKGNKGDKGDKGDIGDRGPKGDKGDRGCCGPKGDRCCIKKNNNDYVWVIKDDIENLSCVLKYQNIIFTSICEINGWIYNKRTGYFKCNNSGKYLVSYNINIATTHCSKKASIIGTINDDEIIGSAITSIFTLDNKLISNSFILDITNCDNFALKIAGTSTNILITCIDGILTEKPISASITITKIS